jgi:hypothetical protein
MQGCSRGGGGGGESFFLCKAGVVGHQNVGVTKFFILHLHFLLLFFSFSLSSFFEFNGVLGNGGGVGGGG